MVAGRPKKKLTIDGLTLTLDEWAEMGLGLSVDTIRMRLRRGISPEDAVYCAKGELPKKSRKKKEPKQGIIEEVSSSPPTMTLPFGKSLKEQEDDFMEKIRRKQQREEKP